MGGGPCYQLVQFVVKIGSGLLRKYRVGQGKVSGCTTLADKLSMLKELSCQNHAYVKITLSSTRL